MSYRRIFSATLGALWKPIYLKKIYMKKIKRKIAYNSKEAVIKIPPK